MVRTLAFLVLRRILGVVGCGQTVDSSQLCDRTFHPSPRAWEDEVLYFLMLDRFSNDTENDYLPGCPPVVGCRRGVSVACWMRSVHPRAS